MEFTSNSDRKKLLRREHRQIIYLNFKEKNALNMYCEKYSIESRSAFIRETIIMAVVKKLEADYPSLFEQCRNAKHPDTIKQNHLQSKIDFP
jgi:hypothetical protein